MVFIQAKIDKELALETKKIIKRYGFKMRHVIESCLQAFVDEVKKQNIGVLEGDTLFFPTYEEPMKIKDGPIAFKIKKAIKFAYQISTDKRHLITMPDNQKIKQTPFPLKNIDDERSKILAAPSTSAYEVSSNTMPYGPIVTGKQIGRAHV